MLLWIEFIVCTSMIVYAGAELLGYGMGKDDIESG